MRRLLVLAVLLAPALAFADAEEASLHLELGPALLRVEDFEDGGGHASIAAARLTARGTYGLSDLVAAELGLGLVAGNGAAYATRSVDGAMVQPTQDERALRVTAGATARFGVVWVPTVTAQVGYQLRLLTNAAYLNPASSGAVRLFEYRAVSDLLAVVGVGLDYRLNKRWTAGVSVQAVHAFSLDGNSYDALEVPFHLSYYWYPQVGTYGFNDRGPR